MLCSILKTLDLISYLWSAYLCNFITHFLSLHLGKHPQSIVSYSKTCKKTTKHIEISPLKKKILFDWSIAGLGFPGGSVVKNLPAKQEMRVPPLGQEAPWRRKWPPTPVFLPGESHGQRSLQGYSPWGHRRVWYDSATKQQEQLAYGVVLILLYSRVIQLCIYIYTFICIFFSTVACVRILNTISRALQ